MIPARVERFCTMALRNEMTSRVMNPAHASASATQLVSMMTSVCLRWMDVPRKRRGCAAPLLIPSPHPIGLAKHIRTDVQPAGLRGIQVDIETDRVVFGHKLDGASVISKVVRLAHREDRSAPQFVE